MDRKVEKRESQRHLDGPVTKTIMAAWMHGKCTQAIATVPVGILADSKDATNDDDIYCIQCVEEVSYIVIRYVPTLQGLSFVCSASS